MCLWCWCHAVARPVTPLMQWIVTVFAVVFRQTPSAAAVELLRHVYKVRHKLLTLRASPGDPHDDVTETAGVTSRAGDAAQSDSTPECERNEGRWRVLVMQLLVATIS